MKMKRKPDWRESIKRKFRWSKFRFEYGRWCWIGHPIEGFCYDCWWEWEKP